MSTVVEVLTRSIDGQELKGFYDYLLNSRTVQD